MLKGKNREENFEANKGVIDTIAAGTVIEGNISSSKGIRIDGKVLGSINCQGKVVVGKNGVVEGNITCTNAEIEGELKSKISVEGLLRLRETAVLLGDIETGKLAIEPGASFTGNCKMGAVVKNLSDKKSSQKAATA